MTKTTNKAIRSGFIIILLLVGIIIVGPDVGGIVVQHFISKGGVEGVEVDQLAFNPISHTFTLSGEQTTASGVTPFVISCNIDYSDIFDQRANIRTLSLHGISVEFSKTAEGWAPTLIQPTAGDSASSWVWNIDRLDFTDVTLRFLAVSDLVITDIDGSFEQIDPNEPGKPSQINLTGSLDSGKIHLQGEIRPFATSISANLVVNLSEIPISELAKVSSEPSQFAGKGNISGQLTSRLRVGEGDPQIDIDGDISIKKATLPLSESTFAAEIVDLKTTIHITGSNLDIEKGVFTISHLSGEDQQSTFDIALLSGTIISGLNNTFVVPTLQINTLSFSASGVNEPFHIQQIDISDLGIDAGTISAKGLSVKEIEIPPISYGAWQSETGSEIEQIEFLDIQTNSQGGTVGSLTLQGVFADFTLLPIISEQSTIEQTLASGELQPLKGKEDNHADEKNWAFETIQLLHGGRILFQDQQQNPSTSFLIDVKTFKASGVSYPAATPFRLTSSGSINRYSTFQIELTGKSDLSMIKGEAKLKSLSLPDFSPYLSSQLGQRIKSGHLNLSANMVANGPQLTGTVDIHMEKFELEAVKDQNGVKGSDLTLSSALKLLRNRNGDIEMSIPIKGDRDAPDFALNRLVTKAIINGAKNGVTSYYAPVGISLITGVALPLGALSVVGKITDWVTNYRFQQISFPLESFELEETQKLYLDEVSVLLQKKPATRLLICGYSTQEELLVQDDSARLLLADNRAQVVKQYLADAGIPTERLFLCDPIIAKGSGEKGRSELYL